MAVSVQKSLRGVIAAIPTPFDQAGAPDPDAFIALAKHLLANGCDALNVLGTTGEATSLCVAERLSVMQAAAGALPRNRMMVGVGAAALTDACELAAAACKLGFAGALVLPPFYYKGISDEGLLAYLAAIVAASTLPLYLYHIPAFSGVPWSAELVRTACARHPGRIVGLKDSSGDLAYARSIVALDPGLAVFPSNEAVLREAREGAFAGCISGSANVNADLCARAWHHGEDSALSQAVAIRKLFEGMNLVAGVKAMLAVQMKLPDLAHVRPPLVALASHGHSLAAAAHAIRTATG